MRSNENALHGLAAVHAFMVESASAHKADPYQIFTSPSNPTMRSTPFSRSLHVFLALASTGFATAWADSWPQFGGPTRDFHVAASPAPGPVAQTGWSIELGIGDAPPIVLDDRLYIAEAIATDEGLDGLQVRCLDARTGQSLWTSRLNENSYAEQDVSTSYPVRPMASLTAAHGRIVSISYGGWVACLSADDGTVQWQHDLVSEFHATPLQFGWSSSPWTDGKVVAIACGGAEALLIGFDWVTGEVVWRAGQGEAAFGSIAQLELPDGSLQLCMIARDQMLGVRPSDGRVLWTSDLPKPRLTNTVTPLDLGSGAFLVAGQGFDGSCRYQLKELDGQWKAEMVWEASATPFYCNWLLDRRSDQVFSYNSLLGGIDMASGSMRWKARGWTDANFTMVGETIVGIRGDGFLGTAQLSERGLALTSGARVVNDRVWAAPVVVDGIAYLRGRATLSAVPLKDLPSLNTLPNGTAIDSMTAMYGEKHEKVTQLLQQAKESPAEVRWETYESVVSDRAIRFGEGDYRALLEGLKDRPDFAARVLDDWLARQPDSIAAYDLQVTQLRATGQSDAATALEQARSVDVFLEVTIPDDATIRTIYATGNAAALGAWDPAAIPLSRESDGRFRARFKAPRGELEFKLTRGSWDTVEQRADGRSISNRRRRLTQPTTVMVQVAGWKDSTAP